MIYGREPLKAEIVAALSDGEGPRVLLCGLSGMGKSSLVEWVAQSPQLSKDKKLIFAVQSDATKASELIQDLAKGLMSETMIDLDAAGSVLKALAKKPFKNVVAIAAAFFKDALAEKLGSAEETTAAINKMVGEAVGSRSVEAQASVLAEATQDDLILTLRDLLNEAKSAGHIGTILIDGMEHASREVLVAAKSISNNLPKGWRMLLAINTEMRSGIEMFRELAEAVTYKGGKIIEVGGLTKTDGLSWIANHNPYGRTEEQLDEALNATEGRPLFFKLWVEGVALDAVAERKTDRLGMVYQNRFLSLSGPAQQLLARAAIAPARLLQCDGALDLLASGIPGTVLSLRLELQGSGFLEQSVTGETNIHDEVRAQVKGLVGPQRRTIAIEVLDLLEKSSFPLPPDFSYEKIQLSHDADRKKDVVAEAAQVALSLLDSNPLGAVRVTGLAEKDYVQMSGTATQSNLLVVQAQALLNAGKYDDALNRLGEAEATGLTGDLQKDANIARLKALLRLNRYRAVNALAETLAPIVGEDDTDRFIEVLRIRNTAQRDLGNYAEAARGAQQLIKYAAQRSLSSKTRSRLLRTLSRSLALAGAGEEAIRAARDALKEAEAAQSVRDVGNAYLALGEAYRHSLAQPEAVDSYERAAGIAEAISNTDSLVWSLLGLADSQLLQERPDQASNTLGRLSRLLGKDAARHHPIEFLHLSLSASVIDYLSDGRDTKKLNRAVKPYEQFEIVWPQQYIQWMMSAQPLVPKQF